MSAPAILQAALLLGLYVLLAGLFGLAYAIGRVQRLRSIGAGAALFLALHLGVLLVILFETSLGAGWKVLLGAASAAFAAIPPLTWRLLSMTHSQSESGFLHARDPRT